MKNIDLITQCVSAGLKPAETESFYPSLTLPVTFFQRAARYDASRWKPNRTPETMMFVWHDLMTNNVHQSLSFYQALFPEWSIETLSLGEHTYYKIYADGIPYGGFVELQSSELQFPSHWMSYIEVANCDEINSLCEQYGGTIAVPAVDVPNIGKFSVIEDPTGGQIKPFQLHSPIPQTEQHRDGHFGWHELHTNDTELSRQFYQAVFGWSAIEKQIPGAANYTIFRASNHDIAGAIKTPSKTDIPSSWLAYIVTEDITARTQQAVEHGALIVVPPTTIPGDISFSVLKDPQEARFGLFSKS